MKKAAIFLIHFVSNLFRSSGLRSCRFHPTCSEYAVEAYSQLHFLKASWLVAKRLLKCQPFSKGGYDPVYSLSAARPRS